MSRVEVRRSADRAVTRTDWLESRHSFASGEHYDPTNTSYGLLLAHNEDVLAPGAGFSSHRHRDVEIVTWVLSGSLVHEDSTGASGVVTPGVVQVLSAGSGVSHVERNGSDVDPVHYVQMWVVPGEAEAAPAYARLDVAAFLRAGAGLVPVASGAAPGPSVLALRQPGASLSVGRLAAGESVHVPRSAYVHLFVARGEATVEDEVLGAGDAARLTAPDGDVLAAQAACEVLVWAMADEVTPPRTR